MNRKIKNFELSKDESKEKIKFKGIKYHQCVQEDEDDTTCLRFVPPDGKFDILEYNLDIKEKPIFKLNI